MKYLSDIIYSTVPITGNQYINYDIKAVTPDWSTSPINSTLLYSGRLYAYRDDQKIYLNDILSSYGDNYSWMSYDNVRNLIDNRTNSRLVNISYNAQDKIINKIKVEYSGGASVDNIDASFYYKDKRLGISPPINNTTYFSDSTSARSFNILECRTNLIPRIPVTNVSDCKFFLGGIFGVNAAWRDYSTINGDYLFRITILDENKNAVNEELVDGLHSQAFDLSSPLSSILINGYIFDGYSPGDWDSSYHKGHYIAISPAHSVNDVLDVNDVSNSIILAQFDKCTSDYYLIWCDRTGGYQCQPFQKRAVFGESIVSNNITNILDETRPLSKVVSNKWELNSDWLTYDEYKAYESIFTSPYTYLYDVQYNELTPVLCDTKEWTEKTSKNNKRLFNLKLNLIENKSQNILY